MARNGLQTATIRDYSGGWNVADNPHNLSSKYLPISDNVIIGVDGALSPRFGSKLFADLRQGSVSFIPNVSVGWTTTINSPVLQCNYTAHPFQSGDHIYITSLVGAIPNIPVQPSGLYGVIRVDANSFRIVMRQNATATGTTVANNSSLSFQRDTHMLAGNFLDMAYFQGRMLIFDDIGEIAAIDDTANTISRVWDVAKSAALVGAPAGWRKRTSELSLQHVSFDTFKQGLICVNGRLNDKPIEINFNRAVGQPPVQFLLDPGAAGGASNGFIYAADFVHSFDSYIGLYGSNNTTTTSSNTPTTVDFSAQGTNCVFVGASSPGDAVQIDLGRVTQTVDPTITGVSNIRDKVFVAFHDTAMLGKIGVSNGSAHDPDFSDQVPQHGSLNHRVIVNMGNDLLMTDYAGVPAFTQSQQNASITPERISQLVDPELNKHLSRLSPETLRYKVFAVYNVRDRQYMLFAPKYDSASKFNGGDTPFYVIPDVASEKLILVYAPNHTISAGDVVTVAGAVSLDGLPSSALNGQRRVRSVINTEYFLLEIGAVPGTLGVSGGGGGVTFAPLDNETIGYVFSFNPQLKIRRWTRFRDLYFTAGVLSRNGRVYFSDNSGRIWEWGTSDRPYYADWIGSTGTSDSGREINFVAETPWSDFSDRLVTKVNESLRVDAQGTGRFTIDVFVDNIYKDPNGLTSLVAPAASTNLVADDAGGFGAGTQSFGGGRRTKEQLGFHFPFRCQIAKLRISGSVTTPLKISAIHLAYRKGSMAR